VRRMRWGARNNLNTINPKEIFNLFHLLLHMNENEMNKELDISNSTMRNQLEELVFGERI
jgi:predicted ArsR family transcriptional regulator